MASGSDFVVVTPGRLEATLCTKGLFDVSLSVDAHTSDGCDRWVATAPQQQMPQKIVAD